ncbi:unnamed protein product [Amoebophrya sp. A120]|nr:unnamed protein product [Amoebophrya sp. A120]|eukprot:GSA120T00007306001.1
MPLPEGFYPKGYSLEKALGSPAGWDYVTAYFPYSDDPRTMSQKNHVNSCLIRFSQFCRCARELGEEDPRCRYQYFRAECNCFGADLDLFMRKRKEGNCNVDILPDRSTKNQKGH